MFARLVYDPRPDLRRVNQSRNIDKAVRRQECNVVLFRTCSQFLATQVKELLPTDVEHFGSCILCSFSQRQRVNYALCTLEEQKRRLTAISSEFIFVSI